MTGSQDRIAVSSNGTFLVTETYPEVTQLPGRCLLRRDPFANFGERGQKKVVTHDIPTLADNR